MDSVIRPLDNCGTRSPAGTRGPIQLRHRHRGSRQWVIRGSVESGSTSHGPLRHRLPVKKFSIGSVFLVYKPYNPLMRTNFPCLVRAICEGELALLTLWTLVNFNNELFQFPGDVSVAR